MAGYTAADVKKLRDETDAPMMECKSALEEANGDYERAKEILREKGKAAAGKKAGRATNAGVVAFAVSADSKTLAAVVVQSETDFVSKNENFVNAAQKVADYVLANGAPEGNPMDDPKLKEFAEEIVAMFRENVQIARARRFESDAPISHYLHHDRTAGTVVVADGPAAGTEVIRKVAVHATAFAPEVVSKEQLSQEKLDAEMEIELKRALEEGKPENIARNIAQGRVNKDYVKRVVLLEQPWYLDQSKSVSQYLAEEAKGTTIKEVVRFSVSG
jgi:elongation factor Ts